MEDLAQCDRYQGIIHALAKTSLLSSPADFHCFQALLTNFSSQPCPFRTFQAEGNDCVSSHNSIWVFLWTLVIICAETGERNSSVKKSSYF